MLSCDDAALVARETALPGLTTLLDESRLLSELRRHLKGADSRLLALRANYVRYKPGNSCLVGYELTTSRGPIEAYATAVRAGQTDKIQKPPKFPIDNPAVGAAFLAMPEHWLQVRFFPNDREVSALHRLADDDARRRLFGKLLPDDPELWEAQPQRVAYRPERRFIAHLSNGGSRAALIKLYSDHTYDAAHMAAKAVSACTPHAPRLLGAAERRRTLAIEWISGRSLAGLLPTAAQEDQARLVAGAGEVLAELHSTRARSDLPIFDTDYVARRLRASADAIVAVAPELAEVTRRLLERLIEELSTSSDHVTLHGDFYAAQVVVGLANRFNIIDFDEASIGPAGVDLGNFIAHIHASAARDDPDSAAALGASFLRGYATVRPAAPQIHTWVAAALLRLAVEPFRRREQKWCESVNARVQRAIDVMETAGRAAVSVAPRVASINSPAHDDRKSIDSLLSLVERALDLSVVEQLINEAPKEATEHYCDVTVLSARVIREKPARRCLVEYVLRMGSNAEPQTVLGKIRAKGLDWKKLQLLQNLRAGGFDENCADSICVPQVLGAIPALNMWLQRKVDGTPLGAMFDQADAMDHFRRVADAAAKIHGSSVMPAWQHTIDDELSILQRRLESLGLARPELSQRLTRLLDECRNIAAAIPPATHSCPIHRDFYHDQILISGGRMYIVDFDLFCTGDPALDVGNFIGHITELAVRVHHDRLKYAALEDALLRRSGELEGEVTAARAETYSLLTLVRHVSISAEIHERRTATLPLLELCEQMIRNRRS